MVRRKNKYSILFYSILYSISWWKNPCKQMRVSVARPPQLRQRAPTNIYFIKVLWPERIVSKAWPACMTVCRLSHNFWRAVVYIGSSSSLAKLSTDKYESRYLWLLLHNVLWLRKLHNFLDSGCVYIGVLLAKLYTDHYESELLLQSILSKNSLTREWCVRILAARLLKLYTWKRAPISLYFIKSSYWRECGGGARGFS